MTFEKRIGHEAKSPVSMGERRIRLKFSGRKILGVFSDYRRSQRGQGRVSKATTSMR